MSVLMLVAAMLVWCAAVLLILNATAVWQASADGPRPGSKLAWLDNAPTVVGTRRSVVPFASGSTALAVMLTSLATSDRHAGPRSDFWLYLFVASMLLLVIGYVFFALTHFINRPRFLVPPYLRSEQGKASAWISRRRGAGV